MKKAKVKERIYREYATEVRELTQKLVDTLETSGYGTKVKLGSAALLSAILLRLAKEEQIGFSVEQFNNTVNGFFKELNDYENI